MPKKRKIKISESNESQSIGLMGVFGVVGDNTQIDSQIQSESACDDDNNNVPDI